MAATPWSIENRKNGKKDLEGFRAVPISADTMTLAILRSSGVLFGVLIVLDCSMESSMDKQLGGGIGSMTRKMCVFL